MKRCSVLLILALLVPTAAFSAVVNVTDASINAGETVTWTSDNTYVLDKFVFVEDGAVLNIEAGTVIKGTPGQGENASALIISRGGRIFAEGTATRPIIFTSEADDVSNPNDIPFGTSGLWGGVIILGRATINTAEGEGNIEGIPSSEPRGMYGGDDDHDSSGVFRYVSIRHGGTDIGEANEINGLTMGAVGDGTTIEYVEVFNNNDDGFEWFGGTVNTRNLIAAFCKDDSFDYDEGFRGKGQFWFTIQGADYGNRGGEHDGGTTPEDGAPYAIPVIYNATYIGSGMGSANADSDYALKIRDNAGGMYFNSIFTDFVGMGVDVEDLDSGEDSAARLAAGDLVIANNVFHNFGAGSDWAAIGKQDNIAAHLEANANVIADPMIKSISRDQDGGLDPRPSAGGAAYGNLADAPASDGFFVETSYKGAFGATNWALGWSCLDHYGFFSGPATGGSVITVTDADINAGDVVTWTSDNTYVLDKFVFVEDGAVLNIEAGTVIKGTPGQGENASALIVSRGGRIFAEGTATNPIIFTAEADDIGNPYDIPFGTSGLWGGVLILGRATINTAEGEGNIEGIPSSEPRGMYGGDDDHDSSGVFRYVSIRHGGTDIGEANEINGLTMGAVGDGTTIEYVEVFNNNDDGFEWFGGTVNTRNLVAAFCKDDSFDYDEGFRGKGQFWFTIQGADYGNRGGEHDGGTTPEDGAPYAIPVVYNATYIGSGMDSANADSDYALKIRDNAGGKYFNSIFTDFVGMGVDVEDLDSGEDSAARLAAGDLVIANNIFHNFGAGSDWAAIGKQENIAAHLEANANVIANPMLNGISRAQDNGLNPVPAPDGPAFENLAGIPDFDGFFIATNYKGAFGYSNWLEGWTCMYEYGFLKGGTVDVADDGEAPAVFVLDQNFPNPFNPTTAISFSITEAGSVRLAVYDILGRRVDTLVDAAMVPGNYSVTWNGSGFASGTYFYRLETANSVMTRKMTLIK